MLIKAYPSAKALSNARFLACPRILIRFRGIGVAGILGQLKDSGVAIIRMEGKGAGRPSQLCTFDGFLGKWIRMWKHSVNIVNG